MVQIHLGARQPVEGEPLACESNAVDKTNIRCANHSD